jgi:uroporphyrinogen decarboxylase
VQGNLDPVSLYAELPILKERVQAVLKSAEGRPGHIFNLGHGVMPDMNPDHVKALVKMVHELGASGR